MRMLSILLVCAASGICSPAMSETKSAIPTPGGELIAKMHANGAQIYECRMSALNTLTWQFREPIATLVQDGMTVGRHFAGPNWEMADGTTVKGMMVSQAPGTTDTDIPNLMLAVTSAKGRGPIASARTILRINTSGGIAKGSCPHNGDVLSVPYSADYAFYGPSHED
jgi:hypothetical protein